VKRFVFALLLLLATTSFAAEYRAYWVETFNTRLGTRAEIDAVLDAAVASNANMLLAQVRRRGDSWYLDSREPLTEVAGVGEPDATGRWTLDPLRYLVDQAHARGIQVHAFTIVTAIYRDDPALKLPADPRHVFLQHFWDRSANALYTDARQWATRTRTGESRFGADWIVDLGHPDAAAYTVDVLTHLAAHYDVDGIHLDRIRYPETADAGYNETNVARFNARHGRSGLPSATDPLWSDWRREQVTNFVRRLYVSVKAIRPAIVVSAALITFGAGPSASGGFERTEAYTRVFQDWQGWAREGILDVVVPMVYKRDQVAAQAVQFEDWTRFAASLERPAIIGLGAYLNTIDGTLRQARFARDAGADGVSFYSLASTSESQPANDFFAASRTLFTPPVPPPTLVQTDGHLRGFTRPDAIVELEPGARVMRSDGSGFFAFVHLAPGRYRVSIGDETSCWMLVEANEVTTVDVSAPCVVKRRAV
jgi:uncharacterized lipoprotein YddW (UPF0748 family)